MICQQERSYERLLKHCARIIPTFIYTNRQEHFLSDYQIVRDPTRTNLFYGQECSYLKVSQGITSSHTASMLSGTTAVLGGLSRISSLSECWPQLN